MQTGVSLVPILRTDITAGTARDVHLRLIAVLAIRAFPNKLSVPDKAYSELLINRVSSQYDIKAPTLYGKIQAVLDYISGMTDVYALDLYRKIKGNSLPAV